MQGDPDVLVALNDILTAELTGINQYFVHFRMLENWGYKRLAQQKREESIEEMKHADKVIERILYLDGIPNLQRLGPVRVGEEPIEMHKLDLTLEREAVARLNQAIALCLDREGRRHPRAARAPAGRRGRIGRLAGDAAQRRERYRPRALPRGAAPQQQLVTGRAVELDCHRLDPAGDEVVAGRSVELDGCPATRPSSPSRRGGRRRTGSRRRSRAGRWAARPYRSAPAGARERNRRAWR